MAKHDMKSGIYRKIYSMAIRGKRINNVPMAAEACFWRLHLVADDFGNLEATPDLLMAQAFTRRREIQVDELLAWIHQLEENKLIRVYNDGSESYIHILDFEKNQPKGQNGKRVSKYPKPGDPGVCWGFLGDPDESKALESPDWMYQTLEPIPGESKIIQRHKDKDNDQDNEHEHEHENENENEQAPIIEALVEPDDDLTADGWDPMSEIPLSEGTGTGTGLDEIEPSDAEPPPVEIQPLDPSIARERGLILWCGTIEPLLGVDEGARHPEGSPKYNRDIASMEAWFAERLWPHEISDEEGRRRLDMAIEQAKLAPTRSTNPMRYLAHYTKKFAESMAHG